MAQLNRWKYTACEELLHENYLLISAFYLTLC